MKKTIFLMLLSLANCFVWAQGRHINMPGQPIAKNNIAENDNGYWCAT